MPDEFQYDVFLSHSAKDKAVVRPLAESLRQDGLKVWFDEWVLKPGDSIPAKIDLPSLKSYGRTREGLELYQFVNRHSSFGFEQLCLSAQAFGSDWAQWEAGTFRFRDPLNRERRFLPQQLHAAVARRRRFLEVQHPLSVETRIIGALQTEKH